MTEVMHKNCNLLPVKKYDVGPFLFKSNNMCGKSEYFTPTPILKLHTSTILICTPLYIGLPQNPNEANLYLPITAQLNGQFPISMPKPPFSFT